MTDPQSLTTVLSDVLASGKSILINCVIEPTVGTESGHLQKLNPQTCASGLTGCPTNWWVRADEQRWSGYGRPEIPLHYHALLKYQNVPAPEAVEAQWKSRPGDAKVGVYGSGGGAAYYIAKMFPYADTKYDLGGLEHFRREDSPIRGSGKWLN